MHHRDLGAGDMGFDQFGEGAGIGVGIDSAGAGKDAVHGASTDQGEELREILGRRLSADVLDVGAAGAFVADR
ncbi:hypothetical protein GCM10023063_08250 [Arthrobacter methylotrophus]